MFAVSCSESVHYVAVSVRSKFLCKCLLALFHFLLSFVVCGICLVYAYGFAFFLWIEAQILEQQSLAWLQVSGFFVCICAVRSKLDVYAKVFRYVLDDLAQGKFRINLAFWLAHVAHHDDGSTVCKDSFECRESAAYAGVIGYVSVLVQWNVEVNAYDCLLPAKLNCSIFIITLIFNY